MNRDFYDQIISPEIVRKVNRRRREPFTIGTYIVETIAATGEAEGLVAFAESTFLGISGAQVIGAAVLASALIGDQRVLRPAS